jgi:D-alanyl-D-alanine carboxypeptidase
LRSAPPAIFNEKCRVELEFLRVISCLPPIRSVWRRIGALFFLACFIPCTLLAAGSKDAPVSREFSVTSEELRTMLVGLPASVQKGILAEPEKFFQMVAAVLDEPSDLFILVDKQHSLGPDYVPPDLVDISTYHVSVREGRTLLLRKAIMPAAVAMSNAARADGVTLTFSSTYRSYKTQVVTYASEIAQYGQEMADRESAHPGLSQHQLGTAIDFGSITDAFADTKAGKWLFAHAEEYGFSLSFPNGYEQVTGYRYESWHYRYITKPGAALQKLFFDDIQQYMIEFLDSNQALLQTQRVK